MARDNAIGRTGSAAESAFVAGDWCDGPAGPLRPRGLEPALHRQRRDPDAPSRGPRRTIRPPPSMAAPDGLDGLPAYPGGGARERAARPGRNCSSVEIGFDQAGVGARISRAPPGYHRAGA
ncbi:hypothetical protein ACU4GR_21305 [Methylobacterium oryzae CBMB20]